MSQGLRVVHYMNQFFGGIGGEDKAMVGPEVRDGAVGPGMAIQKTLMDKGEVVATVTCGDNYFVEKTDEATQEIISLCANRHSYQCKVRTGKWEKYEHNFGKSLGYGQDIAT